MRQGLSDLGYVEGRNLTIEYRWAGGKYEQLGHLAAELVRSKVDVIVTHRAPGSQAAKQATTTIPIVMAVVGNPEEIGLVQSLARPGGNITGSSFMFAEVNAKRVQVLRDAVPALPGRGAIERRQCRAQRGPGRDGANHSVVAARVPTDRGAPGGRLGRRFREY
jgi:ABC transporter substrate binding protein